MKRSEKNFDFSELIKFLGPALILVVLAFWFAYQFVDPAPPRQITIATGPDHGAYHHYGKAYQRTSITCAFTSTCCVAVLPNAQVERTVTSSLPPRTRVILVAANSRCTHLKHPAGDLKNKQIRPAAIPAAG